MRPRALAAAALVLGLGGRAGGDEPRAIAITHVKVYRSPTEVDDDTTLVVAHGQVSAIGKRAAIPTGALELDGTGKIVTAGLVEVGSRIGMTEIPAISATNEGAFAGGIHAAYRASDGYDPEAITIPVARAGGITSAVATPSGGVLAGSSAWVSLAAGDADALILATPLAMEAGLVLDGSRGSGLEKLRELVTDARAYHDHRAAFDANQSRALAASRTDLEALWPVAQGKEPLVIAADKKADLLRLIKLGKELGIRVVVEGGAEAWMVAAALAKAKIPVIVRPSDDLPATFDQLHVRDDDARRLAEAGVLVMISTGDAFRARTLRQECGIAVAAGMRYADALAAVTTTPAKVFGVARGTLAPGAAADLVLWSGDPFELSSRAEAVIIGGVVQASENHQTRLLKRYRKLPRRQ